MRRAELALLGALALGACQRVPTRRLIILGVDGMDPVLATRLIQSGRLPNLAGMATSGTFQPLPTTVPPQSPVAWSSFVTGFPPRLHGIFDFVHRDPDTLLPFLSTSRAATSRWKLPLGRFQLPLVGDSLQQLRARPPFWSYLDRAGVPATVLKIPVNFPAEGSRRARSLSGMGTPDLLGTYGTFAFFTDDAAVEPPHGGALYRLDFHGGAKATAQLAGPPNPYLVDQRPLTAPVELILDRGQPVALLRVGGEERLLEVGKWSNFIPIVFDPGAVFAGVHGMVRVLLKSVTPRVRLYMSPINIDPLDPSVPISAPPGWSADIAREIGRFYTQGMPEDTKALSAGILDEHDFLALVDSIFDEEERILDYGLDHADRGVLFSYFSIIDQSSHIFWGSLDPNGTPEQRAYAEVLPRLYERVDRMVGRLLARADAKNDVVWVISDHGFAPYHTKVDLNAWLRQHGYLATVPRGLERGGPLGQIDWPHTQLYGVGLNGLYVNLKGREKFGLVDESERAALLDQLTRQLLSELDPARKAPFVIDAHRPEPGDFARVAPDAIIGYASGYRASDESALGEVGEQVLAPNLGKWTGDHCIAAQAVPGVLFSNRPMRSQRMTLAGLTKAILSLFGVAPSSEMPAPPIVMSQP